MPDVLEWECQLASDSKPQNPRRADQTVVKNDLIDKAYKMSRMPRQEVALIVDLVFDRIRTAICRSETVKLHGFGKFVVRHKGPRVGRNPKTSAPARISERQVVLFHPSENMKAAVSGDKSRA